MRAANESYALKMNIIVIFSRFESNTNARTKAKLRQNFYLKLKKKELRGLQTLPIGRCDESEEFCKKIKTTVFAWSNMSILMHLVVCNRFHEFDP